MPRVSIWNWLGFRRACLPYVERPEDWKGCINSDTVIVLDWKDWFRLLVSRKLSVTLEIDTEHHAGRCHRSRSGACVLPPTYRVEKR